MNYNSICQLHLNEAGGKKNKQVGGIQSLTAVATSRLQSLSSPALLMRGCGGSTVIASGLKPKDTDFLWKEPISPLWMVDKQNKKT